MNAETAWSTDRVILRRIPFNIKLGLDAWGRPKEQPLSLSLEIPYDFQQAATDDDVSRTLDYGKLFKTLTDEVTIADAENVDHLLSDLRDTLDPTKCFLLEISLPKGSLRAEGGLHFTFEFKKQDRQQSVLFSQGLSIKNIRCACIVGVNPHERIEKQVVVVNLDFKGTDQVDDEEGNLPYLYNRTSPGAVSGIPYADVIRKVAQRVESSTYQTVEALATAIAKTVTVDFDITSVWVEVEKPNAIAAIEAAGVRIYREKSFFTEKDFWKIRRP